MSELDEYWSKFLKDTNRDEEERCSGDLCFDSKGFINDELLTLVLCRKKTAFFTPFAYFSINQEPLPVDGELYIVVDKNNHPKCIIEFANVQIVPYNEVTWEMASKEGEDQNLEEWKNKQREYIEEEGHISGFNFEPDMNLVFQQFNVIYQ